MSIIDITTAAREYRTLQAQIKELEQQADALKQSMIREMDARQVETLEAGDHTIRYGLYESSRLDSARLKADHGGLYEAYSKRTTSCRFQVA
jgi:predicted phage-related endonuclease